MEKNRNLVRNLLRMFHFFLGHHPHMRISYKERHMTNWRHVYFPSGFVYVVLREKIFLS